MKSSNLKLLFPQIAAVFQQLRGMPLLAFETVFLYLFCLIKHEISRTEAQNLLKYPER